jgi:hypothetical protein
MCLRAIRMAPGQGKRACVCAREKESKRENERKQEKERKKKKQRERKRKRGRKEKERKKETERGSGLYVLPYDIVRT